ncbi:MAG: biotin--[Peptococcaceae bacterium]|nr:biotin--[acetyl-CoA-carboxylase] ligase [Peptococcaceae bacterium]
MDKKLTTKIITADKVIHLSSIDSTNAELKRQLERGAVEGTVVWAECQEAGRGRLDRSWVSSEKGIACSVLLTPTELQQASRYAFVTAVAVAEGITKVTGMVTGLKWPNDVLLGQKKVCGILLELCGKQLVIGFGVNVNQEKEDFPLEIQQKATSLALELGRKVDKELLLAEILNALEANHFLLQQKGFAIIARKWTELCAILDAEVVVSGGGQTEISGRVLGLGEDGALLLQTEAGKKAIISGDVSLRGKDKEYI